MSGIIQAYLTYVSRDNRVRYMVDPNFDSKFVIRRKALGLTQKNISDALGISVRAISRWEQGSNIPRLTPDQYSVLCALLRCSIHDLANDFRELQKT